MCVRPPKLFIQLYPLKVLVVVDSVIDITRSPGTRKGNITLSNKRTKRKCIVSRSGKKCLGMKMEIEKNIRENIEKRYRKIEKKREKKK